MPNWQKILKYLIRTLWVRVTIMGLAAVATAAAGIVLAPYIPPSWSIDIGANSIDEILTVLVSSMLTVAVFSLNTLVATNSAASSNITPRATRLLMEDNTSQNTLGTFIGAFLFSLVGIVALSTGTYGSEGRAVLFVVTIGLIVLIAGSIVRWIHYLTRFGQLDDTIWRIEKVTCAALEIAMKNHQVGGYPPDFPRCSRSVYASEIGYVIGIDYGALRDRAICADVEVLVEAFPGDFVDLSVPLARIAGAPDEATCKNFASAFAIDRERSFDEDPLFGLQVLAEIAVRALSTSLREAQTANDVIRRGVRILPVLASAPRATNANPDFYRVKTKPLVPQVFFDALYRPIARAGADVVEVQICLQQALASLGRMSSDFVPAAEENSEFAMRVAQRKIDMPSDLERIRLAQAGLTGLLDFS